MLASNVCLGPDGRVYLSDLGPPMRMETPAGPKGCACLQASNVCLGPDGRVYLSFLGGA